MSLIVPSTFDIALTEELGAVEQAVEVAQVEAVVVGDGDPAQLDAALGGEDVPRHDVGVVLHLREHDGVALAQVGACPRVRDEVDGLGRIADVDDLVRVVCVHEPGDLGARRLECRGRLLGDRVHAAMDVGVVLAVVAVHRVEHCERLL